MRRFLLASGVAAVALLWMAISSPGGGTRWGTVERGDLVLTAEAVGALESTERATLGPPAVRNLWEFKISFLAPEGKQVTAGETVLTFDTEDLERRLQVEQTTAERASERVDKSRADLEREAANARLELAEAESRLGKAKLEAEAPPALIAHRDLQRARIALADAEREVDFRHRTVDQLAARTEAELAALAGERDGARAAVAELKDAIRRMRIAAPRAGTVIYATDHRGEKRKVGDTCWRGAAILELPRLDRLRGVLDVPEADAGKLAVGQRVRLRLDSRPDQEYLAKVTSIGAAVAPLSRDNPRRVVHARIELEQVDLDAMRPAMRFQAIVELGRIVDVLVVPISSLRADGSSTVAIRRRWFGRQRIAPVLGRSDGERVEVLSGLAAGDRVELRAATQPRSPS